MLRKFLIQFSVEGWGCVPSLLFTWAQTMVEVMNIMRTSFKRSHACTATLSVPDPATGHRRPKPLTETLGGHKQNLVCTRTQEKGAVTLQDTESDFPVSV